jgi:hypothetical protein
MRQLLIAVALFGSLLKPAAATSSKKDLYADPRRERWKTASILLPDDC